MKKREREKLHLLGSGFTPQEGNRLVFMRWLWRGGMRRRTADTKSLPDWHVGRPRRRNERKKPPRRAWIQPGPGGRGTI